MTSLFWYAGIGDNYSNDMLRGEDVMAPNSQGGQLLAKIYHSKYLFQLY